MQIFVNTFLEKRVEQLLALLTSYREPFSAPRRSRLPDSWRPRHLPLCSKVDKRNKRHFQLESGQLRF